MFVSATRGALQPPKLLITTNQELSVDALHRV